MKGLKKQADSDRGVPYYGISSGRIKTLFDPKIFQII